MPKIRESYHREQIKKKVRPPWSQHDYDGHLDALLAGINLDCWCVRGVMVQTIFDDGTWEFGVHEETVVTLKNPEIIE